MSIRKNRTLKSLGITASCIGLLLLSACGGGSGVKTYNVSASAGAGGGISPSSTTVDSGGTTQFTVTPQNGYAISSVTGCGGSLSGSTYTTGTITANCTVTAGFVLQYTVTAIAGTGGTISPSSAAVDAGGTSTFTVTPNSGYAINSVTGCGGSLSGSTYTTGTITANCTVTASFVAAWTWAGGSDKAGAPGTYGTQGVAAAANTPGARHSSATWKDASGNLWLFGGWGRDATDTEGDLNDLWEYSVTSGQWTWVGGSNAINQIGVYGTQGVPAASNIPGARHGVLTWTDASGNVWLFGGWGVDSTGTQNSLNDLWKYSPAGAEWTWMSGSDTANAPGVYGTRGVPAASNVPGSRQGAVTWIDASGNLWFFGGESGYAVGQFSFWNDLWEYSPASGEWTWVGGANTADQKGVYGTQGVAATTNVPGARTFATFWTDANGNVWLFGGYGYDSAGTQGELNDLWEYSPASGEWTWVGGSDIANQKGVYGTQGVTAASNIPGAREDAVAWTDASDNVWLFGGGRSTDGADFSDLWEYSPTSGEWTWIGGPNTPNAIGVYGAQGVAAASNLPGARVSPDAWIGANGNLWLFGGWGYDSMGTWNDLNDLWKHPIQ